LLIKIKTRVVNNILARKGWKVKDLAEKMGYTESYVSASKNNNFNASKSFVASLRKTLDVDFDIIAYIEGENKGLRGLE